MYILLIPYTSYSVICSSSSLAHHLLDTMLHQLWKILEFRIRLIGGFEKCKEVADERIWQWLRAGDLPKSTEAFFFVQLKNRL